MSSATILSHNDRAVLSALFDPEASLTNGATSTGTTPNSSITTTPSSSSSSSSSETSRTTQTDTDTVPESVKAAEQCAIATLNTADPSPSSITAAITSLSSIIAAHPAYASAYTNRAQATRLLPSALTDVSTVRAILADLASAITLSIPLSPLLSPASPSDVRVLASAHTHRGYLLLRAASEPELYRLVVSALGDPQVLGLALPSLSGDASTLTPAMLEEAASRDFAVAGRYGNRTAQTLAVKTNPYAKLCGQIVKEALQREIMEFYEVVV